MNYQLPMQPQLGVVISLVFIQHTKDILERHQSKFMFAPHPVKL